MSTGLPFFLSSFVCFILSECLPSFSNALLPLSAAGVFALPCFPFPCRQWQFGRWPNSSRLHIHPPGPPG